MGTQSLEQKLSSLDPFVKMEMIVHLSVDSLLSALGGTLKLQGSIREDTVLLSMMTPVKPSTSLFANLERIDFTVADVIELLSMKNKEMEKISMVNGRGAQASEVARRLVSAGFGNIYEPYRGHAPYKNQLSRKVNI